MASSMCLLELLLSPPEDSEMPPFVLPVTNNANQKKCLKLVFKLLARVIFFAGTYF